MHTIKISGVVLGLALAITAAHARTGLRSSPPPAQGDASTPTSHVTVPDQLRPTPLVPSCDQVGGICIMRSTCVADGGLTIGAIVCPTGTQCCVFEAR
jgi:hypothetical protein